MACQNCRLNHPTIVLCILTSQFKPFLNCIMTHSLFVYTIQNKNTSPIVFTLHLTSFYKPSCMFCIFGGHVSPYWSNPRPLNYAYRYITNNRTSYKINVPLWRGDCGLYGNRYPRPLNYVCITKHRTSYKISVPLWRGAKNLTFSELISVIKSITDLKVIFQKRVRVFHRGFQTRENWWKHEAVGRVLLLFSSVWKPRWNTKHEFLKLLLNRASLTKNNKKILTDFGIIRGI